MRHKKSGRKLNRSGPHRQAMLANMAASLLQHERVVTTPQKAKEVRRFVERLVTLARKGGLSERRRAMAMLKHKTIEGVSAKGNITSVNATKKLFEEIGPRFRDRNGGYTRIVRMGGSRRGAGPLELKYKLGGESRVLRLAGNRLGDNAEQVILEFVSFGQDVDVDVDGEEEEEEEE